MRQSLKLPIDAVLAGALDLGLRHVVGADLLLARDARAFEQRRRDVLRRRGRRRRRRRRRSAHHAVEVTTDDTAGDATLDATLDAVRIALVLDASDSCFSILTGWTMSLTLIFFGVIWTSCGFAPPGGGGGGGGGGGATARSIVVFGDRAARCPRSS